MSTTQRWRLAAAGGALVLAASIAGCLRPGAERATKDLEVGQAEAAGASITVEDGLAAVRELDPEAIALWAQAPSIRFTLRIDAAAAGTRVVTLRNILPDAALTATAGTASIRLIERPIPTVGRWEVTLSAGETTLSLEAPDAGQVEPFYFAVLSDIQEALPEVGDIYDRMNRDDRPRFVFCAGDLTSNGQREELEEFQTRLEGLDIPYFATVGNHELYSLEGPTADSWFELYGRANLHFRFKGVVFTLVDSADGMIDPMVYGWLDGWLEDGRDDVHIFGTHIPPFDPTGTRNGSFGNRSEAAALLTKLADAGVDLTLYGHVHSYYTFSNADIPAFISGGGGAIPEQFDGIGRHYLVVSVDAGSGSADVASGGGTVAAGVRGVEIVRVD